MKTLYALTITMFLSSCGFTGTKCGDACNPEQTPDIAAEDPIPSVGSVGPVGPRGDTGSSGKDGTSCTVVPITTGVRIVCGNTSSVILNGTAGIKGDVGSKGDTGQTGLDGVSCTTETIPTGVRITCGNTVSTILNGTNGLDGKNGIDGQNATPVTMIKFCPNTPDVYPTTFPERGICLDNKIYAVYYSGTAFLSYLTPGNYVTTSVNTNCAFTVQEGTCNILH